ncbi:MAG: PDZ domain-containing protein [Planctomycetaceae bacterium]|nr:PDZ domain-containing protein [Planctomycetaceae bacterium]
MLRRPTLPACCLILALGFALGAAWSTGWMRPVQADPVPLSEADRDYEELRSDRNPLAETSRVLAKISSLVTPSVVHIQSERRNDRRVVEETGSGAIVVHPKSGVPVVITNRHVVANPTTPDERVDLNGISIQVSDGRVLHPTKLLSDKATDIAILKLPDVTGLRAAQLGDSDALDIGHMVLAMGSPFGLSRSVTLGIISAKARRSLKLGKEGDVLNQDFLQTDAAINPGNSGGPLVDLKGRIIGINTAIASNSGGNDGIGFSIPSNLVKQVMDQLIDHGKVQRSYLGVKLDPDFDITAAQRLRLDRARGAHIVEVYNNTPASRAQLKSDDVVMSFDGIDVQDENHLINLVSLTPVGRTVRLVVHREGRKATIQVMLSDRTELEQRSEQPDRPGVGVPVKPMGLTVHQLDRTIAPQLGYTETQQGIVVLSIDQNSPLAKQIELYDLIFEIGRQPVRTVADLERALAQQREQRTIAIRVQRRVDGRLQERNVEWVR